MTKQMRIGVSGASGYTGGEVCRLLLGHPNVGQIIPASRGETPFDRLHPNLMGAGLTFVSPEALAERAGELDAVLFCTPAGEAMKDAKTYLGAGAKVIDLSPDFRFPDPAQYEAVYGRPHAAPHLLKEAVYGVTELNRKAIAHAKLVANPGCYAITTILAVAPALRHNLLDPSSEINVFAVNGTTGAGGEPARETSHASAFAGMLPYSLEGHRHGPELECQLGLFAGRKIDVVFTTAHGNFARGIQAVISLRADKAIAKDLSRDALTKIWTDQYGSGLSGERFVVINAFSREGAKKNAKSYYLYPNVARLAGSNYCHISLDYDPEKQQIKIAAATDNLVKGAAGSAIQNLNLMFGLPEGVGLMTFGL